MTNTDARAKALEDAASAINARELAELIMRDHHRDTNREMHTMHGDRAQAFREAAAACRAMARARVADHVEAAAKIEGPYPGCHHPEKCNATGRCPRDPVCFN